MSFMDRGFEIYRNALPGRGDSSGQQFSVTAEGGAKIQRWLRVHQVLSENPMISVGGDPRLELGDQNMDGVVLKRLRALIVCDAGELGYELKNYFIVNEPEAQTFSTIGGMMVMEQPMRRRTNQKPWDMAALADRLRVEYEGRIQTAYNHQENEVTLIDPELNSVEPFQLHTSQVQSNIPAGLEQMMGGAPEVYCLHLKAGFDEIDQFERQYRRFADLVGAVTRLVYLDQRSSASFPSAYKLSPPKSIERVSTALEAKANIAKRMSSAGVDSDEGIRGEMKSKIKVERRPDVTFADVAGCDDAKHKLSRVVSYFRHPEIYRSWGAKPPRGALLEGPPGTGKTLLARAVAGEANVPFYSVKPVDVLSSLVGRTERNIRAVFDIAEEDGRAIVFFDEVDALTGDRQNSFSYDRGKTETFLTCMEGFDTANSQVVVIAATNRIDALDPAIIRSGRFTVKAKTIKPGAAERLVIADLQAGYIRKEAGCDVFVPGIDFSGLGSVLQGMTGADIREIFRSAVDEKAYNHSGTGVRPGPVSIDDLKAAAANITTPTSSRFMAIDPRSYHSS